LQSVILLLGFHPPPGTAGDAAPCGELGLTQLPINKGEDEWATKQLTQVFQSVKMSADRCSWCWTCLLPLAPTNRFDEDGFSRLIPIVKGNPSTRVLFDCGSAGYLQDLLKQFKRDVLLISDSEAPSYNVADGNEESNCNLVVDGVSGVV
jgi:hypothetical protein